MTNATNAVPIESTSEVLLAFPLAFLIDLVSPLSEIRPRPNYQRRRLFVNSLLTLDGFPQRIARGGAVSEGYSEPYGSFGTQDLTQAEAQKHVC